MRGMCPLFPRRLSNRSRSRASGGGHFEKTNLRCPGPLIRKLSWPLPVENVGELKIPWRVGIKILSAREIKEGINLTLRAGAFK